MADEKAYKGTLLSIDEALEKLAEWLPDDREYRVMQMAYHLWQETEKLKDGAASSVPHTVTCQGQ